MAVPSSDFIRPGASDLEPDPCEPGSEGNINTPRRGGSWGRDWSWPDRAGGTPSFDWQLL